MKQSPYARLPIMSAMASLVGSAEHIIEPYPIKRRYVQPDKTPDPDRQAAAQAKRERKAEKRRNDDAKCVLGEARALKTKKKDMEVQS
jgi:hypothetical protein